MSETPLDITELAAVMRRVWDGYLMPERYRMRKLAERGGFHPNGLSKVDVEFQLRELEKFENYLMLLERDALRMSELYDLVR